MAKETSNFHKTYTVVLNSSIPVNYICDHCQKDNNFTQKRTFSLEKTIIAKNVYIADFDEKLLDLPSSDKTEMENKLLKDYKQYIKFFKKEIEEKKYHNVDALKCDYCYKNQGWQSKYQFRISVGYLIFVCLIIIGVVILFANILNLFLETLIPFIDNIFIAKILSSPTLFGLILGFIVSLIYFCIKYNKISKKRYETLNTDKQNQPIVQFEQAIYEIKVFPYKLENRLKK